MRDINFDQVSIVRIPAHMGQLSEACEGCPDTETCADQVYSISVGGVVLAEANTATGVLKFLDDYLPKFGKEVLAVEEALNTSKTLYAKMEKVRAQFAEIVETEGPPPPEFN